MKRHALFVVLLCWFAFFFAETRYALTIPASEDTVRVLHHCAKSKTADSGKVLG